MDEGETFAWRDVLERHYIALVDELTPLLDSGLREALSRALEAERSQARGHSIRACDDARQLQAESLNLGLRRLRRAKNGEEVLQSLYDISATWAQQLVILTFENTRARVAAGSRPEERDQTFDVASAPALVSAIETRDPVIALATAAELSPPLASLFHPEGENLTRDKVYLFSVTSRDAVMALLVASGTASGVAPLEALCEAAGMRLEALDFTAHRASGASTMVPGGAPAASSASTISWDQLSPEDQKLHLQAQRMARVRVAEIRLNNEVQLKDAIARGDIYGSLRGTLGKAREQFQRDFIAKSSTMVDYLHLEILRKLAHEDDRLLGEHYPGPMV